MSECKITFQVEFDLDAIANEIMRSGIQSGFEDGLLDVASELQRLSPIGATKGLISSWEADSKVDGFDLSGEITNKSNAAINRVVGRPPGLFPPLAPIQAWVQAKIEPEPKRARRIAFLVGRAIATRGTRRFRDRNNWAGLKRDGTFIKGGLLDRADTIIINSIKKRLSYLV